MPLKEQLDEARSKVETALKKPKRLTIQMMQLGNAKIRARKE